MALIPHAQLDELIRDAVSLDLDDLAKRAEHLEQESRARAAQILADAGAERQQILAGAHEQGRAAGHTEGYEAGVAEGRESGRAEILAQLGPQIEAVTTSWVSALDGFEAERDSMLSEARTDVVRLALAMASKVTNRVVTIDEEVARAQLEHLLGLLTRPTRLRLEVHPDDLKNIQEALPDMLDRFDHATHAEIVPNESLIRGSVVAKRDTGGVLDASIKTQLDRLIEEVLPGHLEDES